MTSIVWASHLEDNLPVWRPTTRFRRREQSLSSLRKTLPASDLERWADDMACLPTRFCMMMAVGDRPLIAMIWHQSRTPQ